MATNNETSSKNKNEGATLETFPSPSPDSVLAYPLQLQDSERYGGLFTAFTCMVYNGEAITTLMTRGASKDVCILTPPNGGISGGDVVASAAGAKMVETGAKTFGATEKTGKRLSKATFVASLAGLGYSNNLSETDKKEIKCLIALPTPSITSDYSFSWSEPGDDVANAIMLSDALSGGSGIIDSIGKALGVGRQFLGKEINSIDVASFASGIAKNSMKTQLFKDVGLRSFGFSYKFAPKSQAEAKAVNSIVKWFKYTAHPDYNDTNYGVLNYPFVFSIKHYITTADGRAIENENLPKHTLSVLESVSVTYGNNGFINTFSDGRPTEISIDLKFKELFTLTRSDILEGF